MDDDAKVTIVGLIAVTAVILGVTFASTSSEAKLMKAIAVERGYGSVDERGVFKWKEQK